MTAKLKVGLMGYGFAGETFHAPVIEHCGRATVAAIATGKPERAQSDYPNATIVETFDALIELQDVDCIVIATPNDTHFDLARRGHLHRHDSYVESSFRRHRSTSEFRSSC